MNKRRNSNTTKRLIILFPGDAGAAAGAVPLANHHGDRPGQQGVGAAVGRPGQEEEGRAVEPAPGGEERDEAERDGATDECVIDAQ